MAVMGEKQGIICRSNAFSQFQNTLRSKDTRISYTHFLSQFINYLKAPDCDLLLTQYTTKEMQSKIIEYIVYQRDVRQLSPNRIKRSTAAIKHFFEINDYLGISWKKVKKFAGEFYTVVEDRPYTRFESNITKKLNILIGQAPNFTNAELENVPQLSNPGTMCLYHVDIPPQNVTVTDIAIQNPGDSEAALTAGSTVVIGVNEIVPGAGRHEKE